MSKKIDTKNLGAQTQDGVKYPRDAPWPKTVSYITLITFPISVVLAIYVLVQTNIFKLVIWLIAMVIFAYPLRLLVCARCPYYGQHCSTIMGKTTPLLFKHREGKSMKLGLWLDLAFFFFLFIYPLPETWQVGGFLITLLWLASFLVLSGLLTRLACSVCPFTFCPIGKVGRAFWRLFSA